MILEKIPTRKELTANARNANAVPWRLAHRDYFSAKAPGLVTGGLIAANALCLYPLAVMVNENILCTLDRLKTLTITEKAKSFKETTPAYIPGLETLTNFLQHDNIYSSFGILNLDSFALTR